MISFSYSFATPLASSISGTQSVKVGDRVTVSVSYSANSSTPIYTASGDIKYDANALTFSSASFADTWLPMSRAPYDVTESGHLVRTAGYPGGLSSSARFATFTFIAKQAGTTNITLSGGLALDENNNDLGVQARTLQVTVKGDEPVKKEIPVEEPVKPKTATKIETKPAPAVEKSEPQVQENVQNQSGSELDISSETQDKAVVVKGADINIGISQNKKGDYLNVSEVKVQDTDLNEVYKKKL